MNFPDEIAEHAEFFSFGTNDLTQMGCGFSRDDSGTFLNEYLSTVEKYYGGKATTLDMTSEPERENTLRFRKSIKYRRDLQGTKENLA